MQVWAIISVIPIIKSLLYDNSEFIAFIWKGMSYGRKKIANVDFR